MNTASLEAIQSDQRAILTLIDLFRQHNIDSVISLPQIVVCGDQSSGKSSVLEAITEIPFPRNDNLCTRFATEIILCHAPTQCITTRVIPDKGKSLKEKEKIEAFQKSITDFTELPALIDTATMLMDIGQDRGKAFSKDVLSIKIEGPDRPQLTVVDLPGLIHAENKSQSKEDVELVRDLVKEYITEPRTIILAVISAKNDYANQVILRRCREVDPDGSRTLGIITKPDSLDPTSDNEAAFISLSKNEDIFFFLGWHILKNRGYEDRKCSFQQRNASEKAFFEKGEWAKLPRDMVGVESLRARLSELLLAHIKRELPHLKRELEGKYAETTANLEHLGQDRTSPDAQLKYLMRISMEFNDIARAGANGQYEAPFFGKVDSTEPLEALANKKRLRAMVQNYNTAFAQEMRINGSKYMLPMEEPNDVENGTGKRDISDSEISVVGPRQFSDEEAIAWVKRILVRTRGRELPGTFNPLVISELFWEQSEKWMTMATLHTEKVAELCETFVELLLDEIAPADVTSRLQGYRIEQELKGRLEAAQAELSKIIADLKLHPISYNRFYVMTLQNLRCFENTSELDMDRHSCRDALKSLQSYYQVS
jgi:GTPase SAR1 family protein